MVNALRKLFIKDYANIESDKVRLSHAKMAAVFGIITNSLLVLLKVFAAIMLFASTSALTIAIVADAGNNLTDLASNMITLIGFKISGKPADKEHPYGHQRAEYITGLIISMVAVFIGIEALKTGIEGAINSTQVYYDLLAIIVLGISVLIKLFQSYINRSLGKVIKSTTLKATSMDSLADAIGTTVIMVGAILTFSFAKGSAIDASNVDVWKLLDNFLGIAVGGFLIFNGIKMAKDTISPLMGENGDKELADKIAADILAHDKILGVHDIHSHSYGPTKFFITLHAEIDDKLGIEEAHEIIDDIEREIGQKHRCEITIHMDPVRVGDPETERLKILVGDSLTEIDPSLTFHDFRVVHGVEHSNILFDVVIPFDSKLTEEDIKKELSDRFGKLNGKQYYFVIHADRPYV